MQVDKDCMCGTCPSRHREKPKYFLSYCVPLPGLGILCIGAWICHVDCGATDGICLSWLDPGSE